MLANDPKQCCLNTSVSNAGVGKGLLYLKIQIMIVWAEL